MQIETIEAIETGNELIQAQEKINTGLVAFNNKKAELEALAKSAAEITINGIEDKEGYKLADAKRKELKGERVQITKEGKSMRDTLNLVNKGIIEKEKELVAIISGEEKRLVDEIDKIEAEKERIRQEAIKAEEQRIQGRIDSLAEFGFAIDLADIKNMSDETFTQYKEAAKAQFEKDQAEKAEAERLQKEQAEKERLEKEAEAKKLADERKELEELREKQAEAQRIIDEKNAEIERENKRIADEKLKMQQDKENARCQQLSQLGLQFDFSQNSYTFKDICVGVVDIKTYADEAWNLMIPKITARKSAIDKEIADQKEKELEEAKKKAAADALQAKKEKEEREAEEARIKASQQPDKVQINAYIKSIQAIEVPVMKSTNGKKIMASIQELVGKLTSYSTEKANTL